MTKIQRLVLQAAIAGMLVGLCGGGLISNIALRAPAFAFASLAGLFFAVVMLVFVAIQTAQLGRG